MATATITLLGVCAGGDHVSVRLTIAAQNFDFNYAIDELRDPITADERRLAMAIMARFHCAGMTKAQAKTEMQAPGISVVTS